MEERIVVMPVTASGIGSYMVAEIDDKRYKSAPVTGEVTNEIMKEQMEEIYGELDLETAEKVKKQFEVLLAAMKNSENLIETTPEFGTSGNIEEVGSVEEIIE